MRPPYASLNESVFKLFLFLSESVTFLNSAGSAFHSRCAAAAKARSPNALVLVRGCMNVICHEERMVCALHHFAPVAHTDILELCRELQGTSATVLYSKLSVSLVTNVAAFARQRCVRYDARMLSALQHCFAHVAVSGCDINILYH